jgi:hypothetical protein
MTSPLHNQSRPLLTGLAQAGVDLGDNVTAARKDQQDALNFVTPYAIAANNAAQALRSPEGDFKKRSTVLVKANAELQAAQLANQTVQATAESNLLDAINSQINSYDEQLIELFNSAVEEHKLNEVAPSLPDFTADGMKLDVLSLDVNQADAVLAWKSATLQLHQVWQGYVRLAAFQGFELGPVGMDSLWINRLTAVCLGANTSAEMIVAAQIFVAADSNVESSRQIRALLPFVASAISGFDLQLRPTSEATSMLRQLGEVRAPGAVTVV